MNAQTSTSPISGLFRSIRDAVVGEHRPTQQRSAEVESYLAEIDLVRDFVDRFAIPPSPDNYQLIYRHSVLKEPGLHSAIDALIEGGTAPETGRQNEAREAELDQLAQKALQTLGGVESLVAQSHNDAQGFGRDLEGGAAQLSKTGADNNAVHALIELTRSMIVKTKAAEVELKKSSEAIGALQNSLLEAKVRADTDVLTGLSNRRAFERELGACTARCTLNAMPMCLAIVDVDHFKSINDQFGHVTGDRVLKLIGSVLEEHCGAVGSVARFGGEEFVIIFENCEWKRAYDIVDAARIDLAARKIVKKETGEPLGRVSFSGGICSLEVAGDPGELLKIADRCLYAAKANGRNCIIPADR